MIKISLYRQGGRGENESSTLRASMMCPEGPAPWTGGRLPPKSDVVPPGLTIFQRAPVPIDPTPQRREDQRPPRDGRQRQACPQPCQLMLHEPQVALDLVQVGVALEAIGRVEEGTGNVDSEGRADGST